jgi:signal transduction histidine kinase
MVLVGRNSMSEMPYLADLPRRSRLGSWLAVIALMTGLSGIFLTLVSLPDLAAFDDEVALHMREERTAEILQIVTYVPGLLATSLVGWYLLRFRAARPVGMVLLSAGLVIATFGLVDGFTNLVFSAAAPEWTEAITTSETISEFPQSISNALTFSSVGVIFVLLPHVYPDGRLAGEWWKLLFGVTVAAFIIAVVWWFLVEGGLLHSNADGYMELGTTVVVGGDGVPYEENSLLWSVFEIAILSSVLAMLLSTLTVLIYRWHKGSRLVRRQIAVFLMAVVINICLIAGFGLMPEFFSIEDKWLNVAAVAFSLALGSGPVLVVLAIAIAVLRYSLYDIRIVIRRVALYATLTAGLTVIFVAVYSTIGLAVRGSTATSPGWVAALAAVGVVLCVEPARRRLQRRLERRFLGDRGEPLRAMARLRERVLEGDEKSVLAGLVETVAGAVRSPAVTLGIQRGPHLEMVASTGRSDSDPVVVPLVHRGEQLGEFRVSPRTPGESYGRADQALLEQLADQAAAHVYGLRRDTELSAVRQKALTATVAERSRLGRDLHDGLAPLIAGAGLAAEALRRGMVPGSQDEQDAGVLAQRLRTAAGELRRVAHDLQPGPLAQQGLAGALQDYIASLTGPEVPTFDLRVSQERLPPAVELVVYRVVLEAVANVVRHARAGRSIVVVEMMDSAVTVEVRDDGTGLHQPYISGVGMASMRSRIEALGGELTLQAGVGGGTVLRARLPLGE